MSIGRGTALVLGAMVAGCGSGASSPSAQPSGVAPGTSSVTATIAPTPLPTLTPGVLQVIALAEPVFGIASAGDTVWVEGNNRLLQIDGATGARLQELPGWWPSVRDQTLWYMRGEGLVQAEPASGREIASFTPGVIGTTVDDGVLWADDEDAGTLLAVDLARGTTVHELELPDGEAKWQEPWEGAIWVVIDGSGGVIVRVDPDSGEIIDQIDAGIRPHSVAVGFGSLWVTDHGSARVFRFAPTGALEATIDGPGMNVAITATDDAIWAAGPSGLHEIDPTTNTVVREVDLGYGDWYGLASSGRFLWLTSADAGKLYQIDTAAR